MDVKGVHEAPPLAEELLAADDYWERLKGFSSEMWPWYVARILEDSPNPMHIQASLDLVSDGK